MIDGQPFKQIGEIRPTAPNPSRIVCVSDHASNFVPEDVPLGIADELLDEHIAVDIGVHGVAQRMAQHHDIPAHLATVSRLVVDLHRETDHPHLVPTTSDGHLIPGNIGADITARRERFYDPYHTALEQWLDAAQPHLIVSLHSFTPEMATCDKERPWDVALLYNEDDRAARHAIRQFDELGYHVGENEPYSGRDLNATMNRHAEAKGRYYCALEIRQDLIGNRADQTRWAAIVADVMGRVALALD